MIYKFLSIINIYKVYKFNPDHQSIRLPEPLNARFGTIDYHGEKGLKVKAHRGDVAERPILVGATAGWVVNHHSLPSTHQPIILIVGAISSELKSWFMQIFDDVDSFNFHHCILRICQDDDEVVCMCCKVFIVSIVLAIP